MKILTIAILFALSTISFLDVNAQENLNAENKPIRCGEGTILQDGICVQEGWSLEDKAVVSGVIIAAGGVLFAALVTVADRKRDIKKRTQELINSYSDELKEVSNREKNLATKLDCTLYVEQYLDILEKIAALAKDKNFKKDVSDFFVNNFAYGIHLWEWYHENVVKIHNEDNNLQQLWKLTTFSNDAEKTFLEEERWKEFRFWCLGDDKRHPRITKLQSDFGSLQRQNIDEENKYRILPDALYDSYEILPGDDGLTKGEFVELIRSFGNDLGKLSERERNLKTQLDCSVYAEQYLDILERIASLYKKDIIPKRAADYFENNFAFGRNLWMWYEKFVDLKKTQDNPPKYERKNPEEIDREWANEGNVDDRWRDFKWWCKGGIERVEGQEDKITAFPDEKEIDDRGIEVGNVLPGTMYYYDTLPEDDGIDSAQLLDIIRSFGQHLTDLMDKERTLKTKIDCTVYVEQYLDTLEQIAYLFNSKALATDIPTYFENNFAYGLTLRNWYVSKLGEAAKADERWTDFKKYTDEWEKDETEPSGYKNLEPFPPSKLPDSMTVKYENLPEDIAKTVDEIEEDKNKENKNKENENKENKRYNE